MEKCTKEHARLVGKIIFSDFLKKPLDKYRCIIEEVERSSLFERLPIVIRRLSKAELSNRKDAITSGVIAEIVRNSKSLSIRYVYEGFNNMYLLDTSKTERLVTEGAFVRSEIEEFNSYLHKLRRINSRNELTHRVIKGIVKHQGRYLSTGNPIDLGPLSQVSLVDWINREQRTENKKKKDLTSACPVGPPALYGDICNTWVSRLVSKLSLITPSGEEKPLRWFFQTQKDVNKSLIKQLFDKENEDIESGKLKKPYTDNEIRLFLEDRLRSRVTVTKPVSLFTDYVNRLRLCDSSRLSSSVVRDKTQPYYVRRNESRPLSINYTKRANIQKPRGRDNTNRLPSISRRTVGHCRKEMGIPPSKRRLSGYKYPPHSANFSVLYPLTVESVRTNAPDKAGIYEFRLKAEEIDYPNCKTQVIYIGSTRNIKKRLREHSGRNSKNGNMKYFLKRQECFFRYILVKKDWKKEERKLYRLFMDTYGSAPKCTRVSP